MEKPFKNLEHYHDTGEHATSRDLETYKSMVFRDESKNWLRTKPEDMVPENSMQWSMRHSHTLERFIPEQTGRAMQSRKDQTIQFEWDWKEGKIFGGLNNFFLENAQMLDLGSGKGIAVNEINEQFKERGIECTGVDYRYAHEQQTAKNLVAGDFANLPFKDESFNRILSVESFPCWLPNEEQTIDKYIEEITRISQIGTIWRGTLPKYDEYDTIKFPTDVIIRKFVENGWEVFVSGDSFSAKLTLKKSKLNLPE